MKKLIRCAAAILVLMLFWTLIADAFNIWIIIPDTSRIGEGILRVRIVDPSFLPGTLIANVDLKEPSFELERQHNGEWRRVALEREGIKRDIGRQVVLLPFAAYEYPEIAEFRYASLEKGRYRVVLQISRPSLFKRGAVYREFEIK